jgi:hypothetical protein
MNHLDLFWSATPPQEANPPLVVDPNRVLPIFSPAENARQLNILACT